MYLGIVLLYYPAHDAWCVFNPWIVVSLSSLELKLYKF